MLAVIVVMCDVCLIYLDPSCRILFKYVYIYIYVF